jgi:hypothetical protein
MLSQPQGHGAAERNMSVKYSNDTIRNRTRDLPACSAVIFCTRPLLIKRDWDNVLKAIHFYVYWCGWRSSCSCITTGCLTLIIKVVITVGINWKLRMGIRLHHHFRFAFVNVILIIDLGTLIFFCSVLSQLKSHKVLLHSLQTQPYFKTITFIVSICTWLGCIFCWTCISL